MDVFRIVCGIIIGILGVIILATGVPVSDIENLSQAVRSICGVNIVLAGIILIALGIGKSDQSNSIDIP